MEPKNENEAIFRMKAKIRHEKNLYALWLIPLHEINVFASVLTWIFNAEYFFVQSTTMLFAPRRSLFFKPKKASGFFLVPIFFLNKI